MQLLRLNNAVEVCSSDGYELDIVSNNDQQSRIRNETNCWPLCHRDYRVGEVTSMTAQSVPDRVGVRMSSENAAVVATGTATAPGTRWSLWDLAGKQKVWMGRCYRTTQNPALH